jgi:type VI secretion system protein ImpL
MEQAALAKFFADVWQYIKEKKLQGLPWYLVLGKQGAGKSTFITQSNLTFVPAKYFATLPINESVGGKRCNVWITEKAIFLDVPGSALLAEPASINWQTILSVFESYLKKKNFSGVLLIIDLADWGQQNKQQQETIAKLLRFNLLLLRQHLKITCPLFLIYSKIDQIAGFAEFFTDLGLEERLQPCGLEFVNADYSNQNLSETFKYYFDKLLKQLHNKVIWRLHQEHTIENRLLIQQFPWQLESSKQSISQFLYQLSDIFHTKGPLPLQAIYFISNGIDGNTINYLQSSFDKIFSVQPIVYSKQQPYSEQAYFAKQLLTKIIEWPFKTSSLKEYRYKKYKRRAITYVVTASLVMLSSGLMAHGFNQKIFLLDQAETMLSDYKLLAEQLPSDDFNLNKTLPALNILQKTVALINEAQLPWVFQDFYRTMRLPTLAEKTYQDTLNHYFLPGLGNQLEQILSTKTDPTILYGALKTYLMLSDPAHFNAAAIQHWFDYYWHDTFKDNPELEKNLSQHLQILLEKPFMPLAVNQQLIIKTRATLNNIPYQQLVYSILQTQANSNAVLNIEGNNQAEQTAFANAFVILDNNPNIPLFYTSKDFYNVYFTLIPHICNSITQGDWVLGAASRIGLDSVAKQKLATEVRQVYLQSYANIWQNKLANIQVVAFTNWQQGLAVIDSLSSRRSPLYQLINTITANTALDQLFSINEHASVDDITLIKNNLSHNFQAFNDQYGSDEKDALLPISQNINYLGSYLKTIATAKDSDEAAFIAAKNQFIHNASPNPIQQLLTAHAPAPLQNWLDALANNSWRLILDKAGNYLDFTWKNEVLAEYNEHLNNRYPLFNASKNDIALTDFIQFFKPQGTIDTYFNNYLAPFVDMQQTVWQPRYINGQTLLFSPGFLAQIEKALLIRDMFFAKRQLNAIFSLEPIALETNVKSLTFTINGDSFKDEHHEITTPHLVVWPFAPTAQTITLTFLNNNKHPNTEIETGPWSLFHLLDKANLEEIDNTQHFQLTFDANGNAARYYMQVENPVNPFIPGIINTFRCPEHL